MSTEPRTRAWLEVSASALRANLETLRSGLPEGVGLIPMIKADGYGLGMLRAARALEPVAPLALGVATVDEGLRLREAGVERRVVVMSPVPHGSIGDAVDAHLELSISDPDALAEIRRVGRGRAAFHLEVDTGMGRAGLDWRRVGEWGPTVRAAATELRWSGVFTHFHSADLASGAAVDQQWQRFQDTLAALSPLGDDVLVHACNSAAALRFPGLAAGAIRPGIFMYGGRAGDGLPDPAPVATLRARILLIRDAPPGATVGYGATYRAAEWERWATVGLGYGDGLPRALGNRGHGLIRGRRVPIIGRISMDVTVVDISGLEGVERGDVVTFMGRDGSGEISPDDVARQADTISYEILTGITSRVPRIWIDDGGS